MVKNKFSNNFFFANLIYYGRFYDYIYISTGPENNRWNEVFNVLTFYICALLYGDKIILSLRSAHMYTKEEVGFLSFIRNKSIKHIKRITFETKAIMRAFNKDKNIDSEGFLSGLCHNFYPDVLENSNNSDSRSVNSSLVRVGLLGSINPLRRDYTLLISVLKNLNYRERERIKIIALGGRIGEVSDSILRSIAKYVDIEVHNEDWLSQDEFDKKGMKCDIFISNLTKDMRYGDFKGSGTIGDAIYFGKRVIVPYYIDKDREFDEIAVYYDSFSELLTVFKNINEYIEIEVDRKFIDKYSTTNIFNNIKKDLKLDLIKADNLQ